jgi:hypothetical protein
MAALPFERSAWPSSNPSQPQAREEWQATRAETAVATQILQDEQDYLQTERERDIGRAIGNDTRELFVSCDPAEALEQQFDHLVPQYIAVHDVGTSTSRKLLAGIAAAAGRKPQKLVIRRQGYGTTLATLEFVDCPAGNGRSVRLYSTEVDADTQARQAMARMLLGHSLLAVLMVGDLPAHALDASLKPLRDAMLAGHWPNRNMLVLPLHASSMISTHAAELGIGTGVEVRTTPQVTRPAEAWAFLGATWNRLQDRLHPGGGGATLARLSPAPPVGAAARTPAVPAAPAVTPMPVVGAAAAPTSPLEQYVHHLGEVAGMVSCCVFELSSGRALAHAGSRPGGDELARQGGGMLNAMMAGSRNLGLGHAVPDAMITLGQHHLVLRPVPEHPGLVLHAVLDKPHVNVTLVRAQMHKLDAELSAQMNARKPAP